MLVNNKYNRLPIATTNAPAFHRRRKFHRLPSKCRTHWVTSVIWMCNSVPLTSAPKNRSTQCRTNSKPPASLTIRRVWPPPMLPSTTKPKRVFHSRLPPSRNWYQMPTRWAAKMTICRRLHTSRVKRIRSSHRKHHRLPTRYQTRVPVIVIFTFCFRKKNNHSHTRSRFQLSNNLQSLNITPTPPPSTRHRCLAMVRVVTTRRTPTSRPERCISNRVWRHKRTAIRTTPTHKCRTARTIRRPQIRTVRTIRRLWTRTRRNSNRICRIARTARAVQPVLRTVDPCKIFQSVATAPSTIQGKYCKQFPRLLTQIAIRGIQRLFLVFIRFPRFLNFCWNELVCTACFLPLPFLSITIVWHFYCFSIYLPHTNQTLIRIFVEKKKMKMAEIMFY